MKQVEQSDTATRLSRRTFVGAMASLAVAGPRLVHADNQSPWRPRYVVASCMYGKASLAEIVAEVPKAGARALDLWPAPHGNQREQVDELGKAAFERLLSANGVELAIVTRFDLGPLKLHDELRTVSQLGAKIVVCGAVGPGDLKGTALKAAVAKFVEQLEPSLKIAADCGATIAIENHDQNLIESADSLRWLADACAGRPLGIALAPYHMPQDPVAIASLIGELGPRLVHFYAWQQGKGSRSQQPRVDEHLQLPGRGPLDFRPIVAALAKINYAGLTEIFMHPFPRGVAIMDTPAEVTTEINRAREYLARLS